MAFSASFCCSLRLLKERAFERERNNVPLSSSSMDSISMMSLASTAFFALVSAAEMSLRSSLRRGLAVGAGAGSGLPAVIG